jgi:hypothetical protein
VISERFSQADNFLPANAVSALSHTVLLSGGLVLASAVFFVFSYNSGLGYDALEYLVIGRAISRGASLYSFIPSKSPGIYYLFAALFRLGLPQTHVAAAAVTTFLFALTLSITYLITRKLLPGPKPVVVTLLVACCAVFMEMNFIEPEGFVVISGLVAFYFVLLWSKSKRNTSLVAAGVVLAIGFHFKPVAAFYGLAIVLFLLIKSRSSMLRADLALAVGFLIGVGSLLLVFALSGHASDYWLWTIKFPIFHYPSNTFWLSKLYTKLLWFHALLILILLSTLFIRSLRSTWREELPLLAFLMGLTSYLSLLKTQASHYAFPGAVFFSIFITVVAFKLIERSPVRMKYQQLAIAGGVVVLIVAASVSIYRPDAAWGLVQWRHYSDGVALKSTIQNHVRTGQKALLVRDGMLLLWLSDVAPAARFINFDVQATHFVKHNPQSLLDAVSDPKTVLVEFDPSEPAFEDQGFKDLMNNSQLNTEFRSTLEREFTALGASQPPYYFWIRKSGQF